MFRNVPRILALMLTAALCPVCVSPALAAEEEQYGIVFQLPEGWENFAGGGVSTFGSESEDGSMQVMRWHMGNPNPELWAKDQAAGRKVSTKAGTEGFFYENGSGQHCWMMGDGPYILEICTDKEAAKQAGAILAGAKPAPDGADMKRILAAAKSKPVMDWLNHTEPGSGKKPPEQDETAEVPSKPFKGAGLTADVPKDWTAAVKDGTVTFATKDQTSFCVARLLALKKPDDFEAKSAELAKGLGGMNIHFVEGNVLLTTKDGVYARLLNWPTEKGEGRILILLHSRPDPAVDTVLDSVRPE